jgi:hypothetical protein
VKLPAFSRITAIPIKEGVGCDVNLVGKDGRGFAYTDNDTEEDDSKEIHASNIQLQTLAADEKSVLRLWDMADFESDKDDSDQDDASEKDEEESKHS